MIEYGSQITENLRRREVVKFDTDIGSDVDDALALGYLVNSPEVEVVEITTVYGPTKTRLRAAKTLLRTMGISPITLIAGEEIPITPNKSIWTTGKEDSNLDESTNEDNEIVHRASEITGNFSLIATGPLTNIAKLIEEGKFPKNCRQLVIMGGTISPTCEDDRIEHNFGSDPEAAKIVFSQQDIPIILIPLDLSLRYPMTDEQKKRFAMDTRDSSKLLASWMDTWDQVTSTFRTDSAFYRKIYFHDPLAAAYTTHPELFKTAKYNIRVTNDGSLVIGEGKEVTVCEEIDPLLIEHIVTTILK